MIFITFNHICSSGTRFKRRANNERSKRKKKKNKKKKNKKKTYSSIENDFDWGRDNPYTDAYGGKFRNRHCQKRVFRLVS